MYAMASMIDLAISDGGEWKSDKHRFVASAIGICNANVTSRDDMLHIGEVVNNIPEDRIESVTPEDLVKEFGLDPSVLDFEVPHG